MKIYFTRHGLVNYSDAKLSENGVKYAVALNSILPTGIEHIVTDVEERCINTIFPFSIKRGLPVSRFKKNDFSSGTALEAILSKGDCLVCYRIESVNNVLKTLGLPLFTNQNRDEAYEYILVFDRKSRITEKISTGFKKS